jgi:NADH-quinone oxidoreductase subunit G
MDSARSSGTALTATIFGVTGGVMTAALRTAYFYITGEELGELNFKAIEGLDAVKVAEIDIKGTKVRIAVVNGVGNVEPVMEAINKAKAEGTELPYHFVEVMACPGGCIAGGGQPRVMGATFDKPWGINDEIRKLRSKGLNTEDEEAKNRLSHKNKSIQKLYKDYLGEAGGEKSHHLLHTKYQKRPLYK